MNEWMNEWKKESMGHTSYCICGIYCLIFMKYFAVCIKYMLHAICVLLSSADLIQNFPYLVVAKKYK
jgi:hypothetical protein